MTRAELIEAIANANWHMRARARNYRALKTAGGPQRSRARRDLVLKNRNRSQDLVARTYDPASSAATPYQMRRSVLSAIVHATDDPRALHILSNIAKYGVSKDPDDNDPDF